MSQNRTRGEIRAWGTEKKEGKRSKKPKKQRQLEAQPGTFYFIQYRERGRDTVNDSPRGFPPSEAIYEKNPGRSDCTFVKTERRLCRVEKGNTWKRGKRDESNKKGKTNSFAERLMPHPQNKNDQPGRGPQYEEKKGGKQ